MKLERSILIAAKSTFEHILSILSSISSDKTFFLGAGIPFYYIVLCFMISFSHKYFGGEERACSS